jgi:hypothetical protein
VFSGGYLALAVLGRGGIGALFAQPALIALTVVTMLLDHAERAGLSFWQADGRCYKVFY